MAKRDNKPSELERVARRGWMEALRYRMLLRATQPRAPRSTVWRWLLAAASVAYAVTEALSRLGWI